MAAPRKKVAELTAADQFYIQQMRNTLPPEQIAKDVGTTKNVVVKYLETLPTIAEPKAQAPDIKPEESMTGTAISAHTPLVREEDGVTIQTPASSQWGDEAMRRQRGPNYVEGNPDRIFRPRPNKPSR